MTETFECICGERSERRICAACFGRLRSMIAELPEEYVLLTLSRQPVMAGGDGRSSKRLHPPTPGREDTLNLLGPWARQSVTDGKDQVGQTPFLGVLEGWCEVVTKERHLTRFRRNVTAMVDRLLKHLTWLTDQEFAGLFFEEIEGLLRATQRITLTRSRMELLRGVACPSCGMFAMVRYLPDDYAARCRFCSSVRLDQRDLDLLVKAQVMEQTRDDGVNPGCSDAP